jgi:hypothetical protein
MSTVSIATGTQAIGSDIKVNPKTVLVALVLQQVLGALWYSPILFLNPWIQAQGKTAEQIDMSNLTPMILSVIGSLLFATVLSFVAQSANARTAGCGAKLGVTLALGMLVPALAVHYSFLQISSTVILIDGAKELVNGAMIGAFVGACAGRSQKA